ncbi:SIR2 family NAD-dependent protein deacylase [Flavobacterium johnsoniae]|jgi:NAD-dependent deacetylase|uniref:NAD-dependent protein deacylase n=1 Tax=Flavobacterium johnsoniae (strain ATCC 17061 / DSM 2064 / JCM 8514 / BCRC 14874 / CCUG 350202 / NBRC 14942 / NCIMB 11054 / UW101) TaxID=376686 RepID=A5F9V5_FLAJ1|nr:NAD-dependent deacylase [Flavobacterium johnsoniae]ABQ08012.1 Silent information regulator protein Sir2 [Flavobacterium johnsoniae UW101]OXG02089.1 NAD-dependent deacylase [Flavobacterium johnsoniae UW101]WQG80142.1 NAD-dependent deacylase [Flavobacterium johnsoniae UW101]SHK94704.1 NAD-dependent deacetylase [Flavobacterium johnsoniae]
MKKKLVVLTGAGISAESGIKTFRDSDGLWEGHDVMEVATPEGWQKNQDLVLDFYNKRRQQLKEVQPNLGHQILAELEKDFDVYIITQNVDDLHERAGSTKVLHLHGELLKVRSTRNPDLILDWQDDLFTGDFDENGHQLRPHIVWFGEMVPALEEAIPIVENADYFAVIGTSLQVYPAAGLISYTYSITPVFYIDPKPISIPNIQNKVEVIAKTATEGVAEMRTKLFELENLS